MKTSFDFLSSFMNSVTAVKKAVDAPKIATIDLESSDIIKLLI